MPYDRPYNKRKRRPSANTPRVWHRSNDSDEEDDAPIQSSIERINAINDNPDMEDEQQIEPYRPMQGPQNRTMAQRGLRSVKQSARLGRGYADIYGGETRITEVPGPYPTWLPETQTMTHKQYTRWAKYQTASSGTYVDTQAFDIVLSPLDPNGFLTSMSGTTTTGDTAWEPNDISMWNYMETHYAYFTVLACRITMELTDWGTMTASPLANTYQHNQQIYIWPDCKAFEIHYSSDEPKAYDQTALSSATFTNLVQLRNVQVHDFHDIDIPKDTTDPKQRKQVLIIKKEYTKADYNKIVDITTDAENTIWTAVNGSPTLPFYVEFMPRWKEKRTCNASAGSNYFTVYMNVEWDVQWKQLTTDLSGGYWNNPDLHV